MKNPAFPYARKSPVPVPAPRKHVMTRQQTVATLTDTELDALLHQSLLQA